jgi:hypothetical protein
MSAFDYELQREDGTPADPPTLKTAVPKASRRHDPARRQNAPRSSRSRR